MGVIFSHNYFSFGGEDEKGRRGGYFLTTFPLLGEGDKIGRGWGLFSHNSSSFGGGDKIGRGGNSFLRSVLFVCLV